MFKASDWWSAKGWVPASPDRACAVCGSGYGIAFHPVESYPTCQLHSNCSVNGAKLILRLRSLNEKIGMEEWKTTRMNSWDRDAIIPYVSDEVLSFVIDFTISNCRRFPPPASTYDDALQLYAKELNERFKKGIPQ